MNNLVVIHLLAATGYNCDAYGANAYGQCSTSASADSASGGLLAETGYNILLPLALGAAIIIAAIILLVKTLVRRKQNS